jgi:IPT/TIG domain-containing protein
MAIAPSSGPPGTRVTLTGHGFNGSVVVCFGRQAATDVVHVTASGTRLTAIVPPGGGLVAVLAITPDKTSIAAFEYTSSSTPAATMSSSADC